ncbi:MAG: class I mannose-6-phosphate isomerase [Bacteroidales bacterium]|nr:class I mannose-6-phosphate isomerase [Bacteroidales bacterium]
MSSPKDLRKTTQFLMPATKPAQNPESYDIYPTHAMPDHQIETGYETLARKMAAHSLVKMDGYQGVFFNDIKAKLQREYDRTGHQVRWIDISRALKATGEIEAMVAPFLGGDDPLFGSRTTLWLADFFEPDKLKATGRCTGADITIIYGPGAALFNEDGFLVYIDLPKNELQFRARAGSALNLGSQAQLTHKATYKRFYFVDWVVLNRHKQQIWPTIDLIADGQHLENIAMASGRHIREAIRQLSTNAFRVRPWFEPGVWGGTWCKNRIGGLNTDVPNYAWSFELIVPENGLLFESSGNLLEVTFDSLMFQEAEAVQGDAFERFGVEFPIRFDFLDTFDGGNLSVQCHPMPEYTKKHFNEAFTQEETYYILDTTGQAVVYLGFTHDINPEVFRDALQKSFERAEPLEIKKFVNELPASRHDLFLIPPGTIHASGRDNLVLEISTTPYIFTFKLYDWVRPDLDGNPRPLNIERGMENLCFDRKGDYVEKNLKAKPVLIDQCDDWSVHHLATHPEHSYDVHRINLTTRLTMQTNNKFHVMSVVEGHSVVVETKNGQCRRYHYAETFVIPAAAGWITLINTTSSPIMIIDAFIK